MTNKRFGKLVALKPTTLRRGCNIIWECRCDCGNIAYVGTGELRSGHTTSCGCSQKKNLVSQRFGRLTVIKQTAERTSDNCVVWECKCDCGNIKYVGTHDLIGGRVQSCGCLVSKGESKLQKIFQSLNIQYKSQKTFNDCINPTTNRKLYFDFYFPDYNCCIEYDGEQHFKHDKNNQGWNTSEHFEKTRYLDNIKNEYCKQHNIKLIRIPYTDFDILDEKYIRDRIEQ